MITENDKGPQSPPPPPDRPTVGPRRLKRSRDRRIGGVAGGIAEYFGIDPVIVRLGFVVAVFAGGVGLIGYLVAWVVLPESDQPQGTAIDRPLDPKTTIALVLLVVAAWIGISEPFDADVVVPVILIGVGGYLLYQRSIEETPTGASGSEVATSPLPRFTDPRPAPPAGSDATEPMWRPPPPDAEPPPLPRREPAVVTRACLSVLALLFAGAIILRQLGWVEADTSTVIAIALIVVGAAAMIGAFIGKSRGVIVVGALLGLLFAAASVIEPVVEDGVGDAVFRPTTVESLTPSYSLGIGELEVDLSDLDIPDGTEARVLVEMGIGHTVVWVPPLVDLRIEGHLAIGELVVLGEFDTGLDNDVLVERDLPGDALLVLEIDMGIGQAEVRRG